MNMDTKEEEAEEEPKQPFLSPNEALVRSAAKAVMAALGPGHSESVYASALVVELMQLPMVVAVAHQPVLPILHRGVCVGFLRPDLEVRFADHGKLLLELKRGDRSPHHRRKALQQLRKYDRVTNKLQPCMLVHFGDDGCVGVAS